MINVSNNSRVLFIGDSITDIKFNRKFNHKLKGKQVYALNVGKEIQKHCKNSQVFYRGIASNRTYHIYDRLTKDCIDLKPDVIVMLIGVNDAWENYVPEEYPPLRRPMEPHLSEIYRRIGAELDDVQILFLLPFLIDSDESKKPFHTVLEKFRATLNDYALKNGAEVIDLQAVFNEVQRTVDPKKLATDGVHPTNLGHKIISDEVLNHINFV